MKNLSGVYTSLAFFFAFGVWIGVMLPRMTSTLVARAEHLAYLEKQSVQIDFHGFLEKPRVSITLSEGPVPRVTYDFNRMRTASKWLKARAGLIENKPQAFGPEWQEKG